MNSDRDSPIGGPRSAFKPFIPFPTHINVHLTLRNSYNDLHRSRHTIPTSEPLITVFSAILPTLGLNDQAHGHRQIRRMWISGNRNVNFESARSCGLREGKTIQMDIVYTVSFIVVHYGMTGRYFFHWFEEHADNASLSRIFDRESQFANGIGMYLMIRIGNNRAVDLGGTVRTSGLARERIAFVQWKYL